MRQIILYTANCTHLPGLPGVLVCSWALSTRTKTGAPAPSIAMSPRNALKIRLARFGRKHQPVYNIVVANSRKARDALPIEVLGTYNPIATPLSPDEKAKGIKPYKQIELDFHRAKYWLGVGASVSDRMAFLFKRAGLLPQSWPKQDKLSQVIERPVVEDPKLVTQEKLDLFRPRD